MRSLSDYGTESFILIARKLQILGSKTYWGSFDPPTPLPLDIRGLIAKKRNYESAFSESQVTMINY